jgi:hypothetical protein
MNSTTLATLAFSFAAACAAQTGGLSGTVVDPSANPLPGIAVAYDILPSASSQAGGQLSSALVPSKASSVLTDSRGAFKIGNLQAGNYHLCALAAVSGQISSCQSGTRPFVTSVGESANITGIQLVMGSGYVVKIHVQDTNGNIGKGGRFILSAIAVNATYKFASLVSRTAQVLEYELTIPMGMPSRLVVDSNFAVSDATSTAVAAYQLGTILSGPAELTLLVK